MEIKTLVASIMAVLESADFLTVYALSVVYREETKQKVEITQVEVGEALRELVDGGYVVEYEETTLDLSRKYKKYIVTDKISSIAKPLPDKVVKIAKLKHVTPVFYVLINYPDFFRVLSSSS